VSHWSVARHLLEKSERVPPHAPERGPGQCETGTRSHGNILWKFTCTRSRFHVAALSRRIDQQIDRQINQ
jgi:hypothetical protein